MGKIRSAIEFASLNKDNIYQLEETLVAVHMDIGKTWKRLTDLIAKSCDHHGKTREEFNWSRVERGNNSRQEPLVFCPSRHSQDPLVESR